MAIGPFYIFRNPSTTGRARWFKGESNNSFSAVGYNYVFHNSIVLPQGWSKVTVDNHYTVTRNNLWNVDRNVECFRSGFVFEGSSIDYDLCGGDIGGVSQYVGSHNIERITPVFTSGAPTFTHRTGSGQVSTGNFDLAPSSAGYADGQPLNNFSHGYTEAPDRGSHQSGCGAFEYGINANFKPCP